MWQTSAMSNGIIFVCYIIISWNILKGLYKTNQLKANKLAIATAFIFLYCGIHHGLHTFHMFESGATGLAMRRAMDIHFVIWDFVGVIGAGWYLSLRKTYKTLLDNQPSMFLDDNKRKQQAEAINISITEKLVAARLHSEAGEAAKAEEAIGQALEASRKVQSSIAQGIL